METFVTLLIPALLAIVVVRMLFLPIKLALKLLVHSAAGLLCLGLLNSVSGFTGFLFPLNAVTVAIAGFLGLPGMALMALLQILPG